MRLVARGRERVGDRDDVVVEPDRVVHRGARAVRQVHADDDDLGHAGAAEQQIELGEREAAEALLHDDRLAGLGTSGGR